MLTAWLKRPLVSSKGAGQISEGLLPCVEERLLCVAQWVKSGPEGQVEPSYGGKVRDACFSPRLPQLGNNMASC